MVVWWKLDNSYNTICLICAKSTERMPNTNTSGKDSNGGQLHWHKTWD